MHELRKDPGETRTATKRMRDAGVSIHSAMKLNLHLPVFLELRILVNLGSYSDAHEPALTSNHRRLSRKFRDFVMSYREKM